MPEIQFSFSLPKLVHSIALFSDLGIKDLTKLKVVKLLFFADKTHLLEQGAPILGDSYYCMDYGPVPSLALNELNDALQRNELLDSSPDLNLIDQVLRVRKSVWKKLPLFESKTTWDHSVFTDSECAVLRRTIEQYGRYSARQLVDISHRDPTWIIPNKERDAGGRVPIPYELFFEGCDALGKQHLAQLLARFRGEEMEMPGDVAYREFSASLLDDDEEIDWSIDRDHRNRGALRCA
jgi:uncharacterized phage-associated protein